MFQTRDARPETKIMVAVLCMVKMKRGIITRVFRSVMITLCLSFLGCATGSGEFKNSQNQPIDPNRWLSEGGAYGLTDEGMFFHRPVTGKEKKEVRRDTKRWDRGEPLQHHRNVDHLKYHRQDIWFREREEKFETTVRTKREQQIERMKREGEMVERLKDIPLDTGLSNSTDSP